MYAEKADDYLLFQERDSEKGKQYDMLETPFAAQFEQEVKYDTCSCLQLCRFSSSKALFGKASLCSGICQRGYVIIVRENHNGVVLRSTRASYEYL